MPKTESEGDGERKTHPILSLWPVYVVLLLVLLVLVEVVEVEVGIEVEREVYKDEILPSSVDSDLQL